MRRSILPIFIPHLGCPHQCVFCDQKQIACPVIPTPDDVRREIEQGLACAKEPQIAFYGGSFTAIDRELMEGYLKAASAYVQRGQCHSIRLSTRSDAIDCAVLDMLKATGVQTIELGAQSMVDGVLLASGRGHKAEDTERASHRIQEYGFELILQMMVGLPGSDWEKEMQTARRLAALKPDGVRIYPTCVLDKTPLYEMYRRGDYRALELEEAVDICADLVCIFEEKSIPVIRLGLNPTEDLSNGGVKAGAYHPALGEMVYSRIFLKEILPQIPKAGAYEIHVPPKMLSLAIGQKKCNLTALGQISDLRAIRADGDCAEPYIKIIGA